MDLLVLLIAFVVVCALAYAIYRLVRPKKPEVICDHREVIKGKVHKLVETGGGPSEIASIGGPGSGTAMIAYFCKKHCPGGCDQGSHKVET
jgi:hypothetical protein